MNLMSGRREFLVGRLLSLLATFGFIGVLAAGILIPLYTDEIGWRFQERAWIDGIDKSYNDLCGPNSLARVPRIMLPVRWFSAVANQGFASPLSIRIEGLVCAFAWATMLWLLTARLQDDRVRRDRLRALIFAVLGLGTLPFLMVLSRPEQPIILTSMMMILIVFARFPRLGEQLSAWLKVTAIVVLAGIAASYHMKGVAYAPVALVCLAYCGKGRATLAPRVVAAGALALVMGVAASYWAGRFECLGSTKMAAMLAGENVASLVAANVQAHDLVIQLMQNANPLNYVWLAAPDVELSSWLPDHLFPRPVTLAIVGALTLLWGATILFAIAQLVFFLVREGVRGLSEPRALLALGIFASVVVWGASQINRNAYEAAAVLPMLIVFSVLCLTLPGGQPMWLHRSLIWLVRFAVPVALISEVILLGLATGPLIAAARTPGYLPAQRFSVSLADYSAVRGDIRAAMAQAGIPDDRIRRGILVDDVTYLALQRHLLPFHRLGVLEVWNAGIDNPAQYLIDRHSEGVVASCANLPIDFETIASRSGGICAISRAGLKELAVPPPPIWGD